MSRSAPQVEGRPGTTGKGRVEDNNAVILGARRVVGREGSVTEETVATTGGEADGVEVERAGCSSSESVLHSGLLGGVRTNVVEPGGVQCPGDVLQFEAETGSGIIIIQDIDLSLDLGISIMGDRDQGQKTGQGSAERLTECNLQKCPYWNR